MPTIFNRSPNDRNSRQDGGHSPLYVWQRVPLSTSGGDQISTTDSDDSVSKRTRIVFCITELDPGGAEAALTRLVLSLDRDRWEPYVVCLGPHGHFVDALQSRGVPVQCLNATGLRSLPRVLLQLTRELRRLRPALVQTFLFHANLLGRIASFFARVPVVISGLRVAEHRSAWYGRIDRWTNWMVATNICVSQGVADFSQSVVGLDHSKLIVIPNAADFDRFANASAVSLSPFGIPDESRVLISIGRLDRQKGIDILIAAISSMTVLDDDVHFLIVGDGPESETLRNQAAQSRWFSRFHFANRRDDVPELLAASTALILPSRWEGMANVVLEAMAAGRPVIATRVEGITELVRDRVTGLVVSSENPAELSSAIESILGNADFRAQAGRNAQAICQESFTQSSVTSAYVRIYDQFLHH